MVILIDGGIPTKFRYKLSGFSSKRRGKSKIGDSCGSLESITATGGRSPPNFEYTLSTPTEDIVPYLVSVYTTEHSRTLFTVVVNTSTGVPGGWFCLCLSLLDVLTIYVSTDMFTSSSWEVCVQSPAVLDDIMVRALKLMKCVLLLIICFCAVDAFAKCPFLAK